MGKESLEEIGIRMKVVRNCENFTADKIAKLVGANTNYVFQLESGRRSPSMELFFKIASVYEFAPSEFMKKLYSFSLYSKR